MKKSAFELKKLTRIFQAFDTSLGIDVEDTHIKAVKIKKSLKKYRILKQITIPWSQKLVDEKSIRMLATIISENKLRSTYINILTPLDCCLLKKVKIPRLNLGDIKNFLYQNSELYLDLNMKDDEIQMNFHLLSQNPDEQELLVILKRSPISNKMFHDAMNPHFFYSFNYRSIILHNIKLLFFPTFTGDIIDFLKNSIYSLSYENGSFTDFKQYYPENMNEVTNGIEITGKNRTYILSGSEKYFKQLNLPKSNSIPGCIKSVKPEYLNAFAASLSPFIKISSHGSLLSSREKDIIEQLYYKKISLKTLYLLGGALLVFITLSLLIQMGMTIYHDRQREFYDEIKPIISQNELLNSENRLLEAKIIKFDQINSPQAPLAYYMHKIATIVPPDLWLSEVSISSNPEGTLEILLFGYAIAEKDIHNFLKNLENLSFCREMSLEHLATADIGEKNPKRINENNQYYKFKVCLDA